MSDASNFFKEDGPLASAMPGYQIRQQQVDLSVAIEEAIDNQTSLIAEAGTGTGKTFAYAIPAMQSNKKVIISTGTKNLQEQLFRRDLPFVKTLIHKQKDSALLKGRSNYLCLHRLKLHDSSTISLDAETFSEFKMVSKWSAGTSTGDMSDLKALKEGAKVLPLVTSTIDNCLGKDCTFYDECYLVKARQKALLSDVVVVNHHLFFADLALKNQGFGELIPNADCVIFDEAHLIPDIASEYFGQKFSTRQLSDQLNELIKLQKLYAKDASQMSEFAEKCRYVISDLRMQFNLEPEKGNWQLILKQGNVIEQLDLLSESLSHLIKVGALHEGRDKDIDALLEKLDEQIERIHLFVSQQPNDVSLWYETSRLHITVHLTPLSIATQFQEIRDQRDSSWVFTSATLAVDNSFEHFQRLLGLQEATTLCFDSPFDYKNQAMLCVPRYLPEPNHASMKQALIDIAVDVIAAAKGRTFVLFTSHYMMRMVSERVRDLIETQVLVQGEASKSSLLESYLSDSTSALFATGAFWEGIDVKGDDLLCVIIDKLPFASPDDPLLKARLDNCKRQGGAPFFDVQIPQAVISLKQGAGRLIRDANDRGVLIICDNRLVTKGYGSTFLASLPDMQKTRDIKKVQTFLSSID